MKADDYFNALSDSILNVSSKSDLLITNAVIKKIDKNELIEDCLILSCFYMSVFRGRPPFLMDFIENTNVKDKLTKDERKQLGMFFTPRYIAEYIVKETIGPLVKKIKKDKKIKDTVKEICDLTICDPAVGGAIFLICAHDYLMGELLTIKQSKYSIEELSKMSMKCLFGVDINERAVEFSKLIINLNVAKWALKNKIKEYANIVKKDSSLQKDSKGNSKKPDIAQGRVLRKISIKKTTRKKEKKKRVKNAKKNSS